MPDEEYHGVVYSNFDHIFDAEVRTLLETKPGYASHCGWEFHARIRKTNTGYKSEIWQYHSETAEHEAPTLEELIRTHNNEYGSE